MGLHESFHAVDSELPNQATRSHVNGILRVEGLGFRGFGFKSLGFIPRARANTKSK